MSRVTLFEERHESAIGARVEPARVRVKTVALPTEHGGWGLSLEPVALGLLVAPSWPGLFLSVATMGAFLARHPFKIVAGDCRRGRRFPRTPIAERFVLLYGGLAALGLMAAFKTAASGEDERQKVAGSIAMASVAAAIALAGGWSRPTAFGLWLLLAARIVPTILFVRARLRQLHGQTARPAPIVLAHVIALALVLASVLSNIVPALAVAAFLILLLRAFHGFSERKEITAKRIGIRELVFGAMTVLAAALGHYLA
jgi:hypothetical protein